MESCEQQFVDELYTAMPGWLFMGEPTGEVLVGERLELFFEVSDCTIGFISVHTAASWKWEKKKKKKRKFFKNV